MLLAVHISDGVLQPTWLFAGFAVTAVLLAVSLIRLRDEEVPRIALMTAAFFIVSLIHIRVGPTSVHLLMNGLLGIVLGVRAPFAIAGALFLQYWFLQHGGINSLGVNAVVMTVPALAAWGLFRLLRDWPFLRGKAGRSLLILISTAIGIESMILSVCLLVHLPQLDSDAWTFALMATWVLHPASLIATLVISALAVVAERKLDDAPEFALGFLLGELTVLASVALNCTVLLCGGEQHWPVPPLILLVAHLPIAVFEGIILGFTLGFLTKVKPEMLGGRSHTAEFQAGRNLTTDSTDGHG